MVMMRDLSPFLLERAVSRVKGGEKTYPGASYCFASLDLIFALTRHRGGVGLFPEAAILGRRSGASSPEAL